MFRDDRLTRLASAVRRSLSDKDPSHDWSHVQRVLRSCHELAVAAGARQDIVLAAALLHDLVNVPKNHPDRMLASGRSAALAADLLAGCGYADEEMAAIQVAIREHSYSLGLAPTTLESAVLQDADRLDALGAIGVMRATTCGALMGAAYYDAADPFAARRDLNDKRFTIDHYFTKLFKLVDGFHTEAARREAARRAAFMRAFLEQLRHEIEGSVTDETT